MPLYRHLSFDPDNRFLRSPIGRRGFVGVAFPLIQSKDFLHHPVYISSRCSEYNRGSSYHRTFLCSLVFAPFCHSQIYPKQKQGNAAVLPHTTLPCIAQSDTRSLDTSIPIRRVGGYLKESWLCYWYSVIIPTLHPPAQTTT